MSIPPYISNYWGKAQPKEGGAQTWHPLAYHALDVAASADALMRSNPRRFSRLAARLGVDAETLRSVLVLMIALHDIGKFSRHFQAKSTLGPRGKLPPAPPQVRHDAIGYAMFEDSRFAIEAALAPYLDCISDGPDYYAAVAGHHGSPVPEVNGSWDEGFEDDEPADVRAFVTDVIDLLKPIGKLPRLGQASKLLSWSVAGLTNLSDWIGSNSDRFPYTPPKFTLREYWERITPEAEAAVEETGILPAASPVTVDATTLLAHITGSLSPLQQCARDVALPHGPSLTMIEDVTGAGKTEAALLIAARHLAEGRASGIFFALPTMATANAMYDRLSDSYRRLFVDGRAASLVLAHGRRSLNDGFRDSILESAASDGARATSTYGGSSSDADETATAACSAWIADDRRKAFLAHVGVGTVDQAILGVLPSRFQSLRLWGLADRVLIIDEAHAYDSYVSRELETLLEFQAALGGSAVVLSATLSKLARDRLAAAYARGLGRREASVTDESYPLLSVISEEDVTSTAVATRPELARTLAVTRVGAINDAVHHATSLAKRGATVAWIRNTVDDAIMAAELLGAEGLEPILLHARFAMCDRLDIEEKVKTLLGKASTPETRRDRNGHGVVVVGSQILQMSLDGRPPSSAPF